MSDYGLIIDNRKVATLASFDVPNPATGELVGQAPVATRARWGSTCCDLRVPGGYDARATTALARPMTPA